jgi:hypothetical protein
MLDYFRFAHHPEAWEISGRAGSEKIGMISRD